MLWAGWLGADSQFTCAECRELAEANGNKPECDNCPYPREPREITRLNLEALETWRLLDGNGRHLDSFSGVPLPLRLEAIHLACRNTSDSVGIKWRVLILENSVYEMRIRKYSSEQNRRNSKTANS